MDDFLINNYYVAKVLMYPLSMRYEDLDGYIRCIYEFFNVIYNFLIDCVITVQLKQTEGQLIIIKFFDIIEIYIYKQLIYRGFI